MSPSVSEVSIITVNWNGRGHLARLLPSLLPLSAREILVVDNASQDGSRQLLARDFPEVRVLANERNRGFAHPCNQGARAATGEWLAFINNDMRAHPGWLEAALSRADPETPCVASRILDWEGERIDYNGSSLQYLGYALQRDIGELVECVSSRDEVLFPCGGAMLIRRDVFLKLGGFDKDYFAIFEDVDLGWRLWTAGYRVALAPESVVYHRGHATFEQHAQTRMRYLMHRNALLTIAKNYEEESFRRILPLALLMGLRRAVQFSGVARESFYLWAETGQALQAGDPALQARILDSLNHLVAMDDFLQALPRTLVKRRRIQASRRRPEKEILHLFEDPFREIVQDPHYQALEYRHLKALDLETLFGRSAPQPDWAALAEHLEERLKRLQAELQACQWWGMQALLHPPVRPLRPAWRSFWETCRRQGLRSAWRRLLDYVDRGI